MFRRFPIIFRRLVVMGVLEQAPRDRRDDEKNHAARDDQALPAECERRPQDDGERGQSVRPVSSSGQAPEDRGRTKRRERPKKSPDAGEESVEPEEQARLEGCESAHSAGATAATAGARRPKVKT